MNQIHSIILKTQRLLFLFTFVFTFQAMVLIPAQAFGAFEYDKSLKTKEIKHIETKVRAAMKRREIQTEEDANQKRKDLQDSFIRLRTKKQQYKKLKVNHQD